MQGNHARIGVESVVPDSKCDLSTCVYMLYADVDAWHLPLVHAIQVSRL